MFDIDKILGNKKPGSNKSKKRASFPNSTMPKNFTENPFSNMPKLNMGSSSDMSASKKMQLKWSNMNTVQRTKARKKHKDSDGDRVPDIFDCQPNNIMRQDANKLINETLNYQDINYSSNRMKQQGTNKNIISHSNIGRKRGIIGNTVKKYPSLLSAFEKFRQSDGEIFIDETDSDTVGSYDSNNNEIRLTHKWQNMKPRERAETLFHELKHFKQAKQLGDNKFQAQYSDENRDNTYRFNKFEKEARIEGAKKIGEVDYSHVPEHSFNSFVSQRQSRLVNEDKIDETKYENIEQMGQNYYTENNMKNFVTDTYDKRVNQGDIDSDGDGVINVIDCEPDDKTLQDWKLPEGFDSKGVDKYGRKIVYIPVEEAYYMRGRYGRPGQTEYTVDADYKDERELKELGYQRKWDDDFKELNKKYDDDFDKAFDESEKRRKEDMVRYKADIKKRELEKQGYNVYPYKIGKTDNQYTDSDKRGAKLKYRARPRQYEQMIQGVMQPTNASAGTSSGDRKRKDVKNYYEYMKKELETGEVPMLEASDTDIQRGIIGEGRHRILAARELGIKQFPVVVDERTAERLDKYPQGLDETKHKVNLEQAWSIPEFDEESYRTQDNSKFKDEAKREVQAEYSNYQSEESTSEQSEYYDQQGDTNEPRQNL